MKKNDYTAFILFMLIPVFLIVSCTGIKIIQSGEGLNETGHPIKIRIIPGEHYQHKMKISRLISIKNVPQMAVWLEDMEGNFITTLYITKRAARQAWRGTPGEDKDKKNVRRVSALPVWSHHRGVVYDDGLYMPTKDKPMPDAVSSATPKAEFVIESKIPAEGKYIIYIEVNNSTDFNDVFTAESPEGSPGYSGGSFGSGQPAIVYCGEISGEQLTGDKPYSVELKAVGHSSPDGSDGKIYPELTGITTALEIIDSVVVEIR